VRLRRKPWVDEAIHNFDSFVFSKDMEIGEEKKFRGKNFWEG
jgi:tRNA (guanine-N7-)-methyltransferase